MEYRDEIIGKAVDNELERGGQVFVVHNKIQSLEQIKDRIEQMVPRARVICAHGQMPEGQLEPIMKEFTAGRFDVLVSTVIIENGIDIPNVNTIIVIRADAMGLSQLYQLRGRVGRSSEQAYAYFMTPAQRDASEIALRRLQALEQYTDLGSGFQIAMRDLEIRGAGNILGTMQHGFIAAVGFDLYCRLLEDAVKEIKGEPPEKTEDDVSVDIPLEAYLPVEYVPDATARVAVYQRLSAAAGISDVNAMEAELIDRFGALPEPVVSLLLLMRVKALAKHNGCSKVSVNMEGICSITLAENQNTQFFIRRLREKTILNFEITNSVPAVVKIPVAGNTAISRATEIRNILQSIS